jgi:hypothetical protein
MTTEKSSKTKFTIEADKSTGYFKISASSEYLTYYSSSGVVGTTSEATGD